VEWKRLSVSVTPDEYKRWRMWATSNSSSLSALVRYVMNMHWEEMLEHIDSEAELIRAEIARREDEDT
jgi:hypothetical protein